MPAAKQVVIFDACNSGQMIDDVAGKELDPSQIRALDRMSDRAGLYLLTGSAGGRLSYEAITMATAYLLTRFCWA